MRCPGERTIEPTQAPYARQRPLQRLRLASRGLMGLAKAHTRKEGIDDNWSRRADSLTKSYPLSFDHRSLMGRASKTAHLCALPARNPGNRHASS